MHRSLFTLVLMLENPIISCFVFNVSVKSKAGTSSAAGGTPASGSSTAQTPATSEETSTDEIDGCDTDNDERYFCIIQQFFIESSVFKGCFDLVAKRHPNV